MVWAVSISLATTLEITFVFFSSRYLDVSVHEVSSHCWVTGLQPIGLPHSEIIGSIDICSSPMLIAACHVLHRLLEPRHPPYALIYFLRFSVKPFFFTYSFTSKLYSIMSKNLLFNLLICKCADVQIEISNLLVANLNSVEITNCDWYSS